MATAPQKLVLGRGIRLWVANSATPASDAAFTRVSNESSIELSEKADEEKIETKEYKNKISILSSVEVTMKAELQEVSDDSGQTLLPAIGETAIFQLRDENDLAAVKVIAEGPFAAVGRTFKAAIKGVTTYSYDLSAAGEIDTTKRPVATAGG